MSSLLISLFLSVIFLSLLSWFLYFRHWHVGVGVVLEFKAKDNSVWIISRLVESPAGRAGVENYSKVLTIDGFSMNFPSKEEFCEWLKNNPSTLGKKEIWELEERGIIFSSVEMVPKIIKTSIPVYGPLQKIPVGAYPMVYKQGMFYCNKTGRIVVTTAVSPQTYRNIFD